MAAPKHHSRQESRGARATAKKSSRRQVFKRRVKLDDQHEGASSNIWGLFTYRLNFAWTISDGIDHAADITAYSLIEANLC